MGEKWSRKYKTLARTVLAAARHVNVLAKGQGGGDQILQLSHRLEKGMTISRPKSMWGWEKANELAALVEANEGREEFACRVGKGVLFAFIGIKKQTGDPEEIRCAEELEAHLAEKGITAENAAAGGFAQICSEDILLSADELAAAEKLFAARHSVRDFAGTEVPRETILRAAQMANRCPSACNRQPYHVYVVDAEDRAGAGFRNEFNADKFVLVTGRISAFKLSEMNDWIVSASIFAGYLSLALHAYGVGSCVMRKDLVRDTKYNRKMRDLCNIPENEQIVLELAIGNYRDDFRAAVSCRTEPDNLIDFVNAER